MSTATPNMGLLQGVNSDNANTYLVVSLANSLTTIDGHRHANGSNSGLSVVQVNTGTALANAGDVRVNSTAFTYRDNGGSPANHTLAALDIAQTWTATQTFTTPPVIQSSSATALTVGPNGATNPALVVDASATSLVNGLLVQGAGSLNQVKLSTQGSDSGIQLLIAPKGGQGVFITTGAGTFTMPLSGAASFTNALTVSGLLTASSGATITSGNLGVGIAPQPGTGVTINAVPASSGTAYGMVIDSQTTGSSGNYGLYINAPNGSGSNIGALINGGIEAIGLTSAIAGEIQTIYASPNGVTVGGNNVDAVFASSAVTVNASCVLVTGVRAYAGSVTVNSGVTLTRLAALYGAAPAPTVNGTLSNYNSLYLETPSGAAVNRVIDSTVGFFVDSSGNLGTPGEVAANAQLIGAASVNVTAGGATTPALLVSSAASKMGVFFGSGAPTISASQGSLYMRTDGSSTSSRLYVNTNGTTGWTAVTTAS